MDGLDGLDAFLEYVWMFWIYLNGIVLDLVYCFVGFDVFGVGLLCLVWIVAVSGYVQYGCS